MTASTSSLGGDPLALKLELATLKNGSYRVEGKISEKSWFTLCAELALAPKGEGAVNITLVKSGCRLSIAGTINLALELVCVRTLRPFTWEKELTVAEEWRQPRPGEEEDAETEENLLTEAVFDFGDWLRQTIILNVEPYPAHPSTLAVERGEFGLEDGLAPEETKKSPFSVLKNLKS